MKYILILCCIAWTCFSQAPTFADTVTIVRGEGERTLNGEIVVQAQDDSLLFRTRDGRLWMLKADEIISKTDDSSEFEPLTAKQLGAQLLEELPEGFKLHITGDFVIAYNTERTYAKWIGGLYQRLNRGFVSYWKKKKFKLEEIRAPLAVIIFADELQYKRYLTKELGNVSGSLIAYYNLLTNRVAMYDLTNGQRPPGANPRDKRRITDILSNSNAIPMVATVIHEGTHLLMFNNGMQVRLSDTPLWINEGLAMYFETPDLRNSRGWRAIGKINPNRFIRFRRNLASRPAGALRHMISTDGKFRDPNNSLDAYAEAWAFNYFLLNKHDEEYVNYLKFMSTKPVIRVDTPEQRLVDFNKFFEDDLSTLEREFIQYMKRLK